MQFYYEIVTSGNKTFHKTLQAIFALFMSPFGDIFMSPKINVTYFTDLNVKNIAYIVCSQYMTLNGDYL